MRARSLKPGLFKNEILGGADPLLTILFAGLWCLADRDGRLEDRPLRISAELFPYRRAVTTKKVDAMLNTLQRHDFVARYEIDGKRFIQVTNFLRHQNPHKTERPSQIPTLSSIQHSAITEQAPESNGELTEAAGLTPSSLTPDSGLLTPDSPSGVLEDSDSRPPKRTARAKLAYEGEEFHKQVIAAYHELLPELPRVKIWTKERRQALDGANPRML